jgi:hypothetical protein
LKSLETWDDVSMDWEINKQKGKNRHYINNEVLGLASIAGMKRYSEAINIVIERLDNQPFLEEIIEDKNCNTESGNKTVKFSGI